MNVKLIAKTEICDSYLKTQVEHGPESLVMFCARVSNPKGQLSDNPKLLKYCIDNGHWSIFEMANMVVEIETSRAIASQILRHKSFSFQEFSQRYAEVQDCEIYEARRQDSKDRQNSIDDMSEEDKLWFLAIQEETIDWAQQYYKEGIRRGIAKEQMRFILPMSATTKLYMNGNLRSYINYLQVRCGNGTQKEHRDIANEIKKLFMWEYPIIAEALGWS